MTRRLFDLRGEHLAVSLLLALYLALALVAGHGLPPTADERAYLTLGRLAIQGELPTEVGRLYPQGMLPLYAAQSLVLHLPAEEVITPAAEVYFLGRAGLLPFGLLGALGVFVWSRAAFGPRAGVLSLALYALHPILIGYGAQITVDASHATFVTWTGYFLWRFAGSRRPRDLAGVAVGLGLAISCKYTALLIAVPVGLFAAWVAARGAERTSGAAVRGLGALLALVAGALLLLHASYLFEAGFAPTDVEEYGTPLVRTFAATPGLHVLVGMLPEPFARGLDSQLVRGHGAFAVYLAGEWANGHADYYFWSMLLKTPVWILVVGTAALLLRGRALLRGECSPEERRAIGVLALIALPVLAYLSFRATFQTGVRFALFLLPLYSVACGSLLREPRLDALIRGRRGALVGAGVLLLALAPLRAAPNLIAYFNPLGGGQAAAHRWFDDSNSDWGQRKVTGIAELRERTPELATLHESDGPRFGRVAIYLTDLVRRDPEDRTRRHCWLDPFEPFDHADAGWYAFEVTREGFERVAEESADERVRAELAVAYLGEGELDAARRHLARSSDERARPLLELAELLEAARTAPPTHELVRAHSIAWIEAGRPDLALEALAPVAGSTDPVFLRLRVRLLVDLREIDAAKDLLGRPGVIDADPRLAFVLSGLLRKDWRFQEALDLLLRFEEPLVALDPAGHARRVDNLEALLGLQGVHPLIGRR